MSALSKAVSPSRTYVAVCDKSNFEGHYFKKFTLPEGREHANNSDYASWYFLNKLDFFACIIGCVTFEDYSNITDVKKESEKAMDVIDCTDALVRKDVQTVFRDLLDNE